MHSDYHFVPVDSKVKKRGEKATKIVEAAFAKLTQDEQKTVGEFWRWKNIKPKTLNEIQKKLKMKNPEWKIFLQAIEDQREYNFEKDRAATSYKNRQSYLRKLDTTNYRQSKKL